MNNNQHQSEPSKPDSHSTEYAPYPKLDPKDVAPPPPPPVENWTSVPVSSQPPPTETPRSSGVPEGPAPISGNSATSMPPESNPYVSPAPVPASSAKNKMDSVKDVLGTWGKKAAKTSKKAEVLAGNTGPSVTDAAVGRIAQGTKVLAEGGYDKVFRQSFETVPEEKLLKYYACYLSTSAGPVMGIMYLSTAKFAFCSDNPLSYQVGEETQWSYYKVVIPLHQLKAVNPSTSKVNKAEKYIQVISVDSHEFWFMGFVNYDSAVKTLQGALQSHP